MKYKIFENSIFLNNIQLNILMKMDKDMEMPMN